MSDEKRSNGGYEIIESCTIGSTELVIGHNPKAPNPYVCWYCKGGDNYFWGHYCNELSAAREKADQDSVWYKPTEKAKEYRAFEREMHDKMYAEIAERCGEYDRKHRNKDLER